MLLEGAAAVASASNGLVLLVGQRIRRGSKSWRRLLFYQAVLPATETLGRHYYIVGTIKFNIHVASCTVLRTRYPRMKAATIAKPMHLTCLQWLGGQIKGIPWAQQRTNGLMFAHTYLFFCAYRYVTESTGVPNRGQVPRDNGPKHWSDGRCVFKGRRGSIPGHERLCFVSLLCVVSSCTTYCDKGILVRRRSRGYVQCCLVTQQQWAYIRLTPHKRDCALS